MCGHKPCTACAKKTNTIGKAMTKKKTTTKRRRKSRVSGVKANTFNVSRLLAAGAGAIATKYAVNTVLNMVTKDGKNPQLKTAYVAGIAEVVIGGAMMYYSDNEMIQDAGFGAVGIGAVELTTKVLAIPSINGMDEFYNEDYSINGEPDFYDNDSSVDTDQPN